jgi:hypothetical protein
MAVCVGSGFEEAGGSHNIPLVAEMDILRLMDVTRVCPL